MSGQYVKPEIRQVDLPRAISMPVPRREITLMTLIDDAMQRGDDLTKIDRLFDIRDREEKHIQLRAFNRAIARAKANIPTIVKNKTVAFGQGKAAFKHADLAEIDRTIGPHLAAEGLSYRFRSDVMDDKIIVTCMICHEDGHIEKNSLPGPADTSGSKNAIQAIGSTATYLSRYTLMLSLGLAASEDDDGAAAGGGSLDSDQLVDLQDRIERSGISKERLFAKFKITSIADLPASRLGEAIAAIAAHETEKVKRQVEQLKEAKQ